jgi:NRAMP (natural resistance-associated macrophage protein)-like metal ion transporter
MQHDDAALAGSRRWPTRSPSNRAAEEERDTMPPPSLRDVLERDTGDAGHDDAQDLANARDPDETAAARRPWWNRVGPGLITGAADDDPSGIGTYSVAGAQFGYQLLWLVPVCLPLMIAVQGMCGRLGIVTGKGLAAVIKEHMPAGVLHGAVVPLFIANTINIYADLNMMAASAQMLFGGTFVLWLTLMTAGIICPLILVPYRLYVRYLKWLCLALAAYIVTAFMPGSRNDWAAIARGTLIPSWRHDFPCLMTVVGFLGTTISPYLFFWQAGEEVEEAIGRGAADAPGQRTVPATTDELRGMRLDTAFGMFASQAVTYFIMICTAANLHARGITDIETAPDAARALLPLGAAAYWLFALGIVGTGSLAIPTLAGSVGYAVAEINGWRYGLYRRFARARSFYLMMAGTIAVAYALNFVQRLSPVKALFYSAVVNGVLAPPLLLILLLLCNNRKVLGNRCNGRLSNLFGGLAVVLMGAASTVLLVGMLRGER